MQIHSLKIGNVELENNVLLAPMAGITDKAFRKIVQCHKAGLTCTEMCSSKALFFEDKKTEKLMNTEGEKRPIAIQIFGSDPKIMGEISKKVCNLCDIIDINMGCPAPKVVKNGDGSKLLLNPELVENIVAEVVKNASIPVTVKMRAGYDEKHINAEKIAKRIEAGGASAITIHGRTREQYYGGRADLEIIKKVKKAVNIPVIGNGDITSIESAKKMLEQTEVDGIMIGRAALGNPWIFDEIIEKQLKKPSLKEKLTTMLEHLNYAVEDKGEKVAILEMRKHFSWYVKNMKDSAKIREKINKTNSKLELIQCVTEYFKEME